MSFSFTAPIKTWKQDTKKRFLSHEIEDKDLRSMTKAAYNFDVPMEKMDQHTYLLRLDQGPTASFKDFAARMMARLMQKLKPGGKNITILVATSGDTGSAIGEAFKGLKSIKVFILYPESEISQIDPGFWNGQAECR